MTMTKIKTLVPFYEGAHHSLEDYADSITESYYEYVDEQRVQCGLDPLHESVKNALTDSLYEVLERDLHESYIAAIYRELKDFVGDIEYDESVRSTNIFVPNRLYATFTMKDENMTAIKSFVTCNKRAFEAYLVATYKSRDGFISFIPQTFHQFSEETDGFTDYDKGRVAYLTVVLEFIYSSVEGWAEQLLEDFTTDIIYPEGNIDPFLPYERICRIGESSLEYVAVFQDGEEISIFAGLDDDKDTINIETPTSYESK